MAIYSTKPFQYKKNPVVFMVNGIGDGFLALPTIRALANYYYNRLTLIYDASIFPTWVCDLPQKSIILVEVNRNNGSIDFDYFSVAEIINGCDLFISLNYGKFQHVRNFSNLLYANCNIGFDPTFNIVLNQSKDKHASEVYYEVVKIITQSIDITGHCYPPKILMNQKLIVKNLFFYASNSSKDNFILATHTDTQNNKMWNE